MISPELLMIAGLPGCGKTTYIQEFLRDGWLTFDDFKANAIDGSSNFHSSRWFGSLVSGLCEGHRCVVTDIDFCRTEARGEAELILRCIMPVLTVPWVFFAHDVTACERNIRRRDRSSIKEDLEKLRKYSSLYSIPNGADVQPIRTD
jgi:Viral (Superfamily 1) RNA helicase